MGKAKELVLVGGKTTQKRAVRTKDWTKNKEKEFLAALSGTCNVTLAAKKAGVGNTTVYARRAKDAAFRDGWANAIAQGYARLEIETLERALNGSIHTIVHKDGREEVQIEYSDRVALALLRMHRDTAETPARREREEASYSEEEVEELRAKIAAKLERVRLSTPAPLAIGYDGDGREEEA
ncbi:MAG: hypothetical protein LC656_04005 [Sphingomonadales bacterium]|nr:hypothetical protein [Sphingomonadales bacterium]